MFPSIYHGGSGNRKADTETNPYRLFNCTLRPMLIPQTKKESEVFENLGFGAPSESRTPDTMIKSHVLYLLS